jgi:hypothetical protein
MSGGSSPSDRPLHVALALAALISATAWGVHVHRGAHLLHFDAKAHLVVARRTIDSITPGWTQLGAIWLPLPHILNALPAQVDALYTTGLFASALSFVAFLGGVAALAHAARTATGDPWAGVAAAAVPVLNPGWLYLQSTPLIEALFLGTVAFAVAGLVSWRVHGRRRALAVAVVASAMACWVRYEAWPLVTLALAWTALTEPRGLRRRIALVGLGLGVALPILGYGLHSWISSGIPFYAIGSENLTQTRGDLVGAAQQAARGVGEAFGWPLVALALGAFTATAPRVRRDPLVACAWAALAPATVTLTAYLAGHPAKARYALLLAPAFALAVAAAAVRRPAVQAIVLAAAALQLAAVPRPLPVLREATRDRVAVAERRPVLDELARAYAGGRILCSMASLAPVLYELGQRGIPLREIVHEGNENWWEYAIVDPAREVSWVITAKGDVLDQVQQLRPGFPEGFAPALQFRGVTIYRRQVGLSRLTALPLTSR